MKMGLDQAGTGGHRGSASDWPGDLDSLPLLSGPQSPQRVKQGVGIFHP